MKPLIIMSPRLIIAAVIVLLWVLATGRPSHAQAPRSRVEAQAFCYDVIRYTAGGGTDQRYRQCMFDLGYPVAKVEEKKALRENQ